MQARSWEGFTPVHAAAAYGHAGVLGLLLQHGGSATATTLSNVRRPLATLVLWDMAGPRVLAAS